MMAKVTNIPTDKLKRTEINIRKRVESEEKAFHIVNKLIDGNVDGSYLSECGKLISRENYNDIIEERAISLLCGYPVCDQGIPSSPKKRYHISTKTNTVYDISERKNFCSNQCYKASKCFRQQIPESPVWTRKEDPIHIDVSPHKGIPGMVGEVVIGQHPKQVLKGELERLKELDRTEEHHSQQDVMTSNVEMGLENKQNLSMDAGVLSDEIESELVVKEHSNADLQTSDLTDGVVNEVGNEFEEVFIDYPKNKDKTCLNPSSLSLGEEKNSEVISNTIGKSKSSSKMEQLQKLLNKRKNVLSGMVDLQETKSHTSFTNKRSEIELKQSSLSKDPLSSPKAVQNKNIKPSSTCMNLPLNSVCNVLRKWVTVSTIDYLDYKSVNTESVQRLDGVTAEMSELAIDVGCDSLPQILGHQEKEMGSFLAGSDIDKVIHNKPMKSIPDYETLKEESEQFHLKVEEFITGKRVKESEKKKDKKKEEQPVYIPTVDAFDQSQIRIRIVLEKLDKSLPKILVPMDLRVQDVSTLIREIVYTFRLEKDTIIFKPAEWTLVALVLLKILSFKVKSVSDAFNKESSIRYFRVLLEGIKHSLEDLDWSAKNVLTDAAIHFKPHS